MILTTIHKDFERRFRQVIGWTIHKVDYTEIDYYPDSSQPCYKTDYPEIDSVDFSVTLYMTNDRIVEIFWDDEFYFYGIGIKLNEKSNFGNHQKMGRF